MIKIKNKIALGVTGVAITAGAVAAGVALANKKNREKIAKGFKTIQDGQAYQAVAHKIGIKKSAHGGKKLKKG